MAADQGPSPSTGPNPASRPVNEPTPSSPKRPAPKSSPDGPANVTRAGMIWVAVSAGLILLVLLIIFILQNQDRVSVYFFGVVVELSLGMALFIAAVAGGVLVAIAGAARILQLRSQRRHWPGRSPAPPGPATPDRTEPTPGRESAD